MEKDFKKVKCKLAGTDGNVFSLVGRAAKALRGAGFYTSAVELRQRIFVFEEAKSYAEAIAIILEYVEEGE